MLSSLSQILAGGETDSSSIIAILSLEFLQLLSVIIFCQLIKDIKCCNFTAETRNDLQILKSVGHKLFVNLSSCSPQVDPYDDMILKKVANYYNYSLKQDSIVKMLLHLYLNGCLYI